MSLTCADCKRCGINLYCAIVERKVKRNWAACEYFVGY